MLPHIEGSRLSVGDPFISRVVIGIRGFVIRAVVNL